MGTMVQQRNLTAADFGGPALEGCNEHLVLTRPDVIVDIHRAYFEAGQASVAIGDKRQVATTGAAAPLKREEVGSVADALRVIAQFLADEIH